MHLLVLPVSGNLFPVQLSFLSEIIDCAYDPDVIFASSGGAVSAITGLGADWSSAGIQRMVKNICSDLFLQNWWPNLISFLPSWTLGFFRGSIYNSNEVFLKRFFETYFCESLISSKELWIGVGNETKSRPELFCTLPEERARIKKKDFLKASQRDEGWAKDTIVYLNNNIQDIQKMTLASASIPTLVPPQNYNGCNYSDGGVFHASPLSAMTTYLRSNFEHSQEPLHITYINTADIEDPVSGSSVEFYPGIFRTSAMTFANMVSTLLTKDRNAGISLVHPNIRKLKKINLRCNIYVLKKILAFREDKGCQRSFLELYIKEKKSKLSKQNYKENNKEDIKTHSKQDTKEDPVEPLNIHNFSSEDILKLMKQSKQSCYCRFWWYGEQRFEL